MDGQHFLGTGTAAVGDSGFAVPHTHSTERNVNLMQKLLSEVTRAGAFVMLAASAAACSSSPATQSSGDVLDPDTIEVAQDEATLNLVAQVGLKGRVVKFFEPLPGGLLTIRTGMNEVEDLVTPEEMRLRGSALYTYLTHAPAPKALLDAEARATPPSTDDRTGSAADEINPDGSPEPAGSPSALQPLLYTQAEEMSRGNFQHWYCTPTDRVYQRIDVNYKTWQTTSGTNFMRAGVRNHWGTLGYHARYKTGQGFVGPQLFMDGYVPEHWMWGWEYYSSVNAETESETFLEGDETWYDHCINWHY